MKRLVVTAICISFFVWSAAMTRAQDLALTWGLESKHHVEESDLGMNSDWAGGYIAKGTTVRFFKANPPEQQLMKCFDRHWKLWEKFKAEDRDEKSRADFVEYKRVNDPTCTWFGADIAPQLYFDFISSNQATYVLKTIEIRTIDFGEYKGGGFSGEEAWYDITLSHEKGVKTYPVDEKLSFTGTGRAVLRLWSNNYYPSAGWMAPTGAYVIDIKFVFSASGKEVAISTGPFVIDV